MTTQTPLFYSSIGGLTGISFAIGPTVLFAPCEPETLHIVTEGAPLIITAQVPDLFATFLQETIIERRLRRLGEPPCVA